MCQLRASPIPLLLLVPTENIIDSKIITMVPNNYCRPLSLTVYRNFILGYQPLLSVTPMLPNLRVTFAFWFSLI